jgi:superfamily II DNA or RNA helicase
LRERFDSLSNLDRPRVSASVREETAEIGPPNPGFAVESAEMNYVSPAQLYSNVLAVHFAELKGVASAEHRPLAAPTLAAHQERAYERARDIVDRYGGVIIADAVGLGKTFVGLRLLEREVEGGGDALVIAPAALRDQWQHELSYLRAYAGQSAPCQGPPRPEQNLELWVQEALAGRVSLLSMESLGRPVTNAARFSGPDLVVVDEAHNFRNPGTQRYRNLASLVRHSKVVLLTATPINNTLLDLQHLIDLFAAPGAFRHMGISDYRELFARAAAGTGDVRGIVSACVVRRTRRFLRAHYGPVKITDPIAGREVQLRFPRRRRPAAIQYDLADTYGELFASLEEWFSHLHFPSISPHEHADAGRSPAPPIELLKIILLKRLESSTEAFRRTVVQQLAWCHTALRAIESERILTRPDYRAVFRGPADDPGSQLAFFELMLPAPSIDAGRVAEFRRQLEHDARILSQIHATLSSVGTNEDRKLLRLLELLDGPLAGRKVLVFTEYRDTARYIHHAIRQRPHIAQIDSDAAFLGLEPASRRAVIERFAPRSNSLPEPIDRERVDVLIATDVLSEGLNLQDASVVISYDLPWNPVRLMQRSGRIDRLGAIHDFVELYHFVPTHALDRLLGLMARLQGKVATIQGALGLDNPVIGNPADRQRASEHIRMLARDPDGFDMVEQELEGPLDPEEQAYIDSVALLDARAFPRAERPAICVIPGVEGRRARAVAYWRVDCGNQSRGLWLVCDPESGCVVEDQGAAIDVLRTARTGSALRLDDVPDRALSAARVACARYAEKTLARFDAARIAGDALRPGLPQCRIAAWLSRGLQSKTHRPTPDVRTLIDQLLDMLARRFTAAGEWELARIASELPEFPDSAFIKRLIEMLQTMDRTSEERADVREVGLLLIVPQR